jgi:hypothetical protein
MLNIVVFYIMDMKKLMINYLTIKLFSRISS